MYCLQKQGHIILFSPLFFHTKRGLIWRVVQFFPLLQPKKRAAFSLITFWEPVLLNSTVSQTKPQWALLGDLGRRRLRHRQPYGNSTKQQLLLVGRQRRSFLLRLAAVAVEDICQKIFLVMVSRSVSFAVMHDQPSEVFGAPPRRCHCMHLHKPCCCCCWA